MREILVALTLLASIGFYNYHGLLPSKGVQFLFYLFVIICAAYAWLMPQQERPKPGYPRMAWLVFFIGMAFSIPMAFIIHEQPIILTAISTLQFLLPYAFFLILIKLNPDPAKLIRYFFIIVGISIIIYFINFKTFPAVMFGKEVNEDLSRGILRIAIPLFQLLILVFLFSINKFRDTKKPVWLIFAVIGSIMIVLSVIRQAIAVSILMALLLYMQHIKWYKKIATGVILLTATFLIITHIPMYQSFVELTEEQYEDTTVNDKEDVRIGAWRYYSVESQQENAESILFGNGAIALEKSDWGNEFEIFANDSGYLLADVSWAAMVYLFGFVTTIALIYILIVAIIKKKDPAKDYLTYFIIGGFLMGIASGVWYYGYEIIVYMIALYLIYAPEHPDDNTDVPPAESTPPDTKKQFVIR